VKGMDRDKAPGLDGPHGFLPRLLGCDQD